MAKRLSMILAGALLSTGVAFAQSQVTGTVTDENGEPVVESCREDRWYEDRHGHRRGRTLLAIGAFQFTSDRILSWHADQDREEWW